MHVAVGLWTRAPWSVGAYLVGVILLQFVPYTVFRASFVRPPEDAHTLNGLLGTHALLLSVLVALIVGKK